MDYYLTVMKRCSNFRPSKQTVTTALIWVRFRELPLEVFDEESIADMGDLVGKTVRVDPITIEAYR